MRERKTAYLLFDIFADTLGEQNSGGWMARGSYYGGSTIIGPGRSWSGASGFEWSEAAPNGKRRKRRKIKQPQKLVPAQTKNALVVPLEKVHLIMSVMRDLNRPLPMSVKGVNKVLRRMIEERVILADGSFNLRHPTLKQWLARIERPAKGAKLEGPPKSA